MHHEKTIMAVLKSCISLSCLFMFDICTYQDLTALESIKKIIQVYMFLISPLLDKNETEKSQMMNDK